MSYIRNNEGDITTGINMYGRARKKGVKIVSEIELNALKFETRITQNRLFGRAKWPGR